MISMKKISTPLPLVPFQLFNFKKGDFMKFIVIYMVAAAVLMFTGSALATDMPPLAKKYGCTDCHAIDVKMIGPSWMDISKAYNNNGKTSIGIPISDILSSKTAEEWLKLKITHGGAGNWGTVLMPPMDPNDTWQANMNKLVKDIMGLSKGRTSKEDMLKLANFFHCTACHSIDEEAIGPSWMVISNVYNSNGTTPYGVKVSDILKRKTSEEWLILKISHGGLGNWGVMLMPAIEYRVLTSPSDFKLDETKKHEETRELVKFILGLTKKRSWFDW